MLGIIKGDVRYTYLSQEIKDSIISERLEDFYNIDSLMLPFTGINNDYSIKQSNLNLLDILKNNRIRNIYTGNASYELKKICADNNIALYELLKDPYFVKENAYLTSKGLLYFLHKDELDIANKRVLILGYGNIGFLTAKLLKSLDCSFAIYTDNEIERKYCILEGYQLDNDIDSRYNIIINTIPHNIDTDYSKLKSTRIIDVSSAPYGFDIDKIVDNDINYEIMSAIPSKFAPRAAALLIKKYIEINGYAC